MVGLGLHLGKYIYEVHTLYEKMIPFEFLRRFFLRVRILLRGFRSEFLVNEWVKPLRKNEVTSLCSSMGTNSEVQVSSWFFTSRSHGRWTTDEELWKDEKNDVVAVPSLLLKKGICKRSDKANFLEARNQYTISFLPEKKLSNKAKLNDTHAYMIYERIKRILGNSCLAVTPLARPI